MTARRRTAANSSEHPAAPQAWNAASAQAASIGLDVIQANLRAWRSLADALTNALRAQQDIALKALQARANEAGPADGAAMPGGDQFLAPMVAARKAYEQMGEAVVEAQKQALQAFADQERPH
jgi:hypothetical protein